MEEDKTLPGDEELKDDTTEDTSVETEVEEETDNLTEDDEETEDEPEPEESDEETVTLSKAELEKLKEERDNYKQGLLKAKGKDKPKVVSKKDDKFVTQSEFYKANEKSAIETATVFTDSDTEQEKELKTELNEHWSDIMKFFSGRSGKQTPVQIVEDIKDAHAAWKRRQTKPADKENKQVLQDLSKSHSDGKSPKEDKGGERKRIIPKSEPMDKWFPKKEE